MKGELLSDREVMQRAKEHPESGILDMQQGMEKLEECQRAAREVSVGYWWKCVHEIKW